jgi:hypothetical protein
MSSNPEFKWRRTTITRRDGTVVPLPDNWSLIHLPTGLAVAQISKKEMPLQQWLELRHQISE